MKTATFLFMPLFIERLRAFVKEPNIKTWGAVSRLRKRPVTDAFNHGKQGDLPLLMCPAILGTTESCLSCAMNRTGTRKKLWGHCYGRAECLPYSILHKDKLADRLLEGIQLLAICDTSDVVATAEMPDVEKAMLKFEADSQKTIIKLR
jgi:hypothetical protein